MISRAQSEADRLKRQSESEVHMAKAETKRVDAQIQAMLLQAKDKKQSILDSAKQKETESANILEMAKRLTDKTIQEARAQAESMLGDAAKPIEQVRIYAKTLEALKRQIEGYGDQYLVPTTSLLDELADSFGFSDAGQKLKESRILVRRMSQLGTAVSCDYVEPNRRNTAIRFVTDAFNGKVDSILSRVRSTNYGVLEREIKDAFYVINHNGEAFRNARVTAAYLAARLEELRWASTVQALREEQMEEQRRIRERMREEAKAQREYERALKEAENKEETMRKAMEKAKEMLEKADDTQKAEYERRLQELEQKLQAAEQLRQRALSMAQQTRCGHVYVISNIGSFGENVYKIGMTRRLEPLDRVRELGDASVPFGFDIHAMIYSEDAPTLERKMHRCFIRNQVNKVNPRKEFFRLPLVEIKKSIENCGCKVQWTLTAQAQQWRETQRIESRMAENATFAQEWLNQQSAWEPVWEIEQDELQPDNAMAA
ncbi:MAG: DUF4041 domain-containing protein [Gallionella sp.]|nr:MAG: DUF4041 domain-containing protein [Gallionella sp.]